MIVFLLAVAMNGSPAFAEDPQEVTEAPPPASAPVTVAKPAASEAPFGHVNQIFRDTKKVVVTWESSTQNDAPPRSLVFTNPKGEACEGLVEQVDGDKLFVDMSGCTNFDQIEKGCAVTRPTFESFTPPAAPPEMEHEWVKPERWERRPSRWNHVRPSLSLGFNSANQVRFSDVTSSSSGGTVAGHETLDVDSAAQISIGAIWARERGWGFLGNFTFESKRALRGGTLWVNGSPTDFSYASPRPTVQFDIIEANALYRWRFMYVPFGLNYTIPTVHAQGTTEAVDTSGGIGGQFGIGFIVGEYFHLEVLSQFLTVSMKTASPGVSSDLGSGTLSGLVVRGGVVF